MSSRTFMLLIWGLVVSLWVDAGQASLIYKVDRTVGLGGVTGTITTDGTLGELGASNLTSWSLELTDDAGSKFTLTESNSSYFTAPGHQGIVASLTELLFDFGGTSFALIGTGGFFGDSVWCLSGGTGGSCLNPSSELVALENISDVAETFRGASNEVIGAVPEPSVLGLLGISLAAIRFARRRTLN